MYIYISMALKFGKFNKDKCELLHVGRNNLLQQYRWGSGLLRKTWGLGTEQAGACQQCALAVNKASSVPGSINRRREEMVPLYLAQITLHLDRLGWFGALQYLKDTNWRVL